MSNYRMSNVKMIQTSKCLTFDIQMTNVELFDVRHSNVKRQMMNLKLTSVPYKNNSDNVSFRTILCTELNNGGQSIGYV